MPTNFDNISISIFFESNLWFRKDMFNLYSPEGGKWLYYFCLISPICHNRNNQSGQIKTGQADRFLHLIIWVDEEIFGNLSWMRTSDGGIKAAEWGWNGRVERGHVTVGKDLAPGGPAHERVQSSHLSVHESSAEVWEPVLRGHSGT